MTKMRVWRNLFSFLTSPTRTRIAFLSEGRHQWVHLGPLVEVLANRGVELVYLTSADDDPGLRLKHKNVRPLYVGSGLTRTIVLSTLNAGLLVTSIPDMGDFQFRRAGKSVHYVYVHHSLVSTHMIYQGNAFDQFDTIFCAGPHHVAETRARENLLQLPEKRLFQYGYPRLDALKRAAAGMETDKSAEPGLAPHVLVAPSWGPAGLFETVGADLIGVLLDAGMSVTARPHPETRQRTPDCLENIVRRFGSSPDFFFDEDPMSDQAILQSDIMISDWSGVAFEYAFARERPVLFIDLERKIRNPDYLKMNLVPVEVTLREQIGSVLPVSELASAPLRVCALSGESKQRRAAIRKARAKIVFNLETSAETGADHLLEMIEAPSRV